MGFDRVLRHIGKHAGADGYMHLELNDSGDMMQTISLACHQLITQTVVLNVTVTGIKLVSLTKCQTPCCTCYEIGTVNHLSYKGRT